jgi:uncharacterized lipoprotein YajG
VTARILVILAAVLALAAPAAAQQVLRFSSAAPPADFLAKSMTAS